MNFTEKLSILAEFWPIIFNEIRDALKSDHLARNKAFYMIYFTEEFKRFKTADGRADLTPLTLGHLVSGYRRALEGEEQNKDAIAEMIGTMWLTKMEEVYNFIEAQLKVYIEDLESYDGSDLEIKASEEIAKAISAKFGPTIAYIAVILTSVCLHPDVLQQMRKRAQEHRKTEEFQQGIESNTPATPLHHSQSAASLPISIRPKSASPQKSLQRNSLGSETDSSAPIFSPSTLKPRLLFGNVKRTSLSPTKDMHRVSSSYVMPRTSEEYSQILTKSTEMKGYLEKKSIKYKETWKKRWVELKMNKLYYYKSPPEDDINEEPNCGCIPLFVVRSIRTSPLNGKTAFEIDAISRKFIFKSPSEDITNQWLFAFQCSIAEKLDNMIKLKERYKKILKIDKWWKKSKVIERRMISTSSGPSMQIDSATMDCANYVVSLASTVGHRPTMEDAHCIIENVNTSFQVQSNIPQAFFGIFDGHGGKEAAEYASKTLPGKIVHNPNFEKDLRHAVTEAFLQTDEEFLKMAQREDLYCGTAAITAFLRGNRLMVANLGDSRAVLCRKGQAIPMSSDHKPSREDERKRIEDAGGWVGSHKELNLARLYRLSPELIDEMEIPQRLAAIVGFITIHRVMGELSLTRAIGDQEFKGTLKNDFFNKELKEDLILAVPEITEQELNLAEDEFLILACDGLWDVFESQDAVDFIKLSMDAYHDPKKAVTDLVDEAIKLGSMDNVSVLVIFWPPSLVPASPVPSPLNKQDSQSRLVDTSPSKLDILELRLDKK